MQNKRMSWGIEKDKKLVDLVKSNPELYDTKAPGYNDFETKKNTWHKIGIYLNMPYAICKIRWESLRCQYRKNLKKKKMKDPRALNIKWRLEEQMAFLQEFMRERTSTDDGSIISDENEIEDVIKQEYDIIDVDDNLLEKQDASKSDEFQKLTYLDGNFSENSQIALLKYLVDRTEEKSKAADPIDIFFDLMATTVKKFKPADQYWFIDFDADSSLRLDFVS
ncbi:hypothetical protein Trydic_g4725 [Trypoxylus dichotomus]